MTLIGAIYSVLDIILQIYSFMIIASALITWVQPDPRNRIVVFLHRATEPLLNPIRRVVPTIGGVDISPLVALLMVYAAGIILKRVYLGIGL